MAKSELYIGLISGTSVDGVDCVLVEFTGSEPRLLASHGHPFEASLRRQVLELTRGEAPSLKVYGETHVALGEVFAEAVAALLDKAELTAADITAIGSHGQTVWHQPEGRWRFSLQLADPNTIAQRTGITTVADFRGRDMAAGGEGAPLAPLLHRKVFHSADVDRVVVNIGGMANITVLPRSGKCMAFDTGPGNVLMDYWMDKHRQEPFDRDGAWAAQGQFSLTLLNTLLHEPYFSEPVPKSTGRELFNGRWLEDKLTASGVDLEPVNVQATLLTFTVMTIVSDLSRYSAPQELYVCGGGAHNTTLMQELGKVAGEYSVQSTGALGVDPDWVEATAFAWMGKMALDGVAVDTEPFTGASGPVPLGAIYRAI